MTSRCRRHTRHAASPRQSQKREQHSPIPATNLAINPKAPNEREEHGPNLAINPKAANEREGRGFSPAVNPGFTRAALAAEVHLALSGKTHPPIFSKTSSRSHRVDLRSHAPLLLAQPATGHSA